MKTRLLYVLVVIASLVVAGAAPFLS